ncbi:MAG: hypothetical protein AAF368_13535, partial [Planctomycetota bacterium]
MGGAQTKSVANRYALWLQDDLKIFVDPEGYVLDSCAEGAFGIVIEAWDADGQLRTALKFPRLLADTIRENAYIVQLTELEAQMSRVAHLDINQARRMLDMPALVGTERADVMEAQVAPQTCLVSLGANRPCLFKRLLTPNPVEPGKAEQRGGVVFFRYEKGKRPRIVIIRPPSDSDDWNVFPPGAEESVGALLNKESWDALE